MSSDKLPPRTMIRPHEGVIRETPPDPKHNEYPKHMNHPGYRPASVGEEVVHPSGKFKYHVGGTSVAWPPVLAMNADQEEYHLSQGYVVQGKSSPAAFARAVRAEPVSTQEKIEYPKYVGGVLVNDAAQEARMRAKMATAKPAPAPDAAPALSAEGGDVKSASQLLDETHDARIAEIAAMAGPTQFEKLQAQVARQQDQMVEMNANISKLLALVSGSPAFIAPPTILTEEPDGDVDTIRHLASAGEPLIDISKARAGPAATGLSHGEKIRLGKLRKAQERAAAQAGDRTDKAA
jgi:hypothetical protein